MENTYHGHCHCGAVQYDVVVDIEHVLECNCSICRAAGWQLSFVDAKQFTLKQGEDTLVDYQFGAENLHHPFCKQCGIRAFSHGPSPSGGTMYAVNTRCLDDFDVSSVAINQHDGAST